MKLSRIIKAVVVGLCCFGLFSYFMSFYYPLQTALTVGGGGALFVIIIGILFSISNKSVNVMVDLNTKCPHCDRIFEAAFINDELAMSMNCPHCGQLIEIGQVKPLDVSIKGKNK